MAIPNIESANADELAPVLLAAIQRLGQLGRTGAVALARLIDDGDVDFDEASHWITEIWGGGLRE